MRANKVSLIEKNVDGFPVIMTEFGYKTFSIVVKSLGYFTQRTSPTYFRTSGVMETRYGQPQVGFDHPGLSAAYILDLYKSVSQGGFETVVISPGLEMACYLGRVLNAPVLPSQFIASAPNLPFVEESAAPENLYVVGHEADWPDLCVWVKPLNLGELYADIIDQAKNVLILSSHSGDRNQHGTPRAFVKDNISVNGVDSGHHYWDILKSPEKRGYQRPGDHIPHWEFAMEYQQIVNLEKYCRRRGIRTAMVSTGDWSCFIPAAAYAGFYEKNKLRPKGITFHAYWGCHPFYESEFQRIPIYNFQYGAGVFVEEFGRFLNHLPFEEKNGEYLIWSEEYNRTKAMDPAARFESWGFPTLYRTDRPYDVWQYGWNDFEDPQNPTREWIIPRLRERNGYRRFKKYLTFDEVILLCKKTRKTNVTVYP